MPSYEVALILKTLSKPEIAATLKRTASKIIGNNGLIFGIENLGTRQLPFAMTCHKKRYREGSYFLIKFDSATTCLNDLKDEYDRDVDIIRASIIKAEPPPPFECTFEEEMKPPAYRADVQKMIEIGRKKEKRYDPKIGLPYNPWK